MRDRNWLGTALIGLTAAAVHLAGCSETAGSPDGAAGAGGGSASASGLAVVNSDFTSTSLSLLSATGDLARPSCVQSMIDGTGSATISGDVILPSQAQPGGEVILIDRGNTALTFVDPSSCTFDHQISVKGGFNHSNPHDVVVLSTGKAYVTRYETNASPTDPTTSGDDVLIVDPREGTVLGHVGLSGYAAAGVQARPDRAIVVGGEVIVSLNEISGDYSTYADSALVAIDPATDTVAGSLTLTGLKDCSALDVLAGTSTVLVVCSGSPGDTQLAESAIALVDVSGATPALTKTIAASAIGNQPLSFQALVARVASPARQAFVVATGTFPTDTAPAVPDAAFVVDLDTGAPTQLVSSGAYNLGVPALAGTNLLLPDGDASQPRVHVFDVSAAPVETSAFLPDSVSQLPPRIVAWY